MEAKSQKVSAFEAKTKLSELLRETEQRRLFCHLSARERGRSTGPPCERGTRGRLKTGSIFFP